MATTTREAVSAPAGKPTSPGKGRKKLFVVLALLLAATAGWYFLLGPGAGKAKDRDAPPKPGEVLALEPITMNLADGRLLKVALALQLPVAKEGEKEEELNGSVALDEAISFLGKYRYVDLVSPDAREVAKAELSTRVSERYHGEVMQVYFTEFIMQ